MKYIRTKKNEIFQVNSEDNAWCKVWDDSVRAYLLVDKNDVVLSSEDLEGLIQPGDLLFYRVSSDHYENEFAAYLLNMDDVRRVLGFVISRWLVPYRGGFRQVAEGNPYFIVSKNETWLQNKGKMTLL